MINRIQVREIFAWMALAIAIVLFSVSVAFSQTRNVNVTNKDGKVHLKISTTENGKSTELDTTFNIGSDDELEKIIQSLDATNDKDAQVTIIRKKHKDAKGGNVTDKKSVHRKEIHLDLDLPELSENEIKENIRESMKDLKKGISEMQKSLSQLHIHIDRDEDDVNFDMDLSDLDMPEFQSEIFNHHFMDDDLDSLRDKDHFIIVTDADDESPVLEKVVNTPNGKKVYIYKKSGTSKKDKSDINEENENQSIRNIKCYPNPTQGVFTVSFEAEKKSDLKIAVTDDKGNEVARIKLVDFEGEFSKEFDLTDKSKGNYFVKISQGKNTVVRNILIN